jgi:hypothetical protein
MQIFLQMNERSTSSWKAISQGENRGATSSVSKTTNYVLQSAHPQEASKVRVQVQSDQASLKPAQSNLHPESIL